MSRAFDSDEHDEYQEMSSTLDQVRSDIGWKDYLYVTQFLKEPGLVLPWPKVTSTLECKPLVEEAGIHQQKVYSQGTSGGSSDHLTCELNELLWKQEHPEREDRLDAIIEESQDYIPRFMYALGVDPFMHPKTIRLMETLNFAASCVVFPWKQHFKRVRPSFIEERLDPAIQVPSHYSYPSGHATQAHLIKHALSDIEWSKSKNVQTKIERHIEFTAENIAVNREWAGVHYESDSEAGKALAKDIWEIGKGIDKDGAFKPLLDAAQLEWES